MAAIALWLLFASSVALRLAAAAAGSPSRARPALADPDLPHYSIVAPLRAEARVLARLLQALDAIDYPRAKLDVKIVIEEDDREMLTALARMRLPSRYEVIVAPAGEPKTKPRALNVALPSVRGEFVVVYDAEDAPAPDQLRLAAARFAEDGSLDCLQARLVIHNIEDGWIPKLFATEYAALFDVVIPGLAALGAPIALGGSSNHFRTSSLRRAGAWDAWNVTEDADLGLRFARLGLRVGALDSDTLEEAPRDLKSWLKQRCRWHKGWFQTLIVHSRNPLRLLRELGWARGIAALALLLGVTLGGLVGPALFGVALWRCFTGELFTGPTILDAAAHLATLALMWGSLQAILTPIVIALRGRGWQRLYRSLPLLPVYYALASVAAWAGLFELVRRPHHWAKTEHGLVRARGPDA
jgi:cellulose synthase/poly-beta-1,6-N-acetylglucosamine synthase-like glycosyltransferase